MTSPLLHAASSAGSNDSVIRARIGDSRFAPTPPDSFLYMPAGRHTITPFLHDKPFKITVEVGPDATDALNSALRSHAAGGRKPFFCFDHKEEAASFWPDHFDWTPDGIVVSGEWSDAGADAIRGKTHRAFSPAFLTDRLNTTADQPARITSAPLAMGSLVNNQAFDRLPPLWAKNSGGQTATTHNTTHQMTEQELAALKATLAALESEINTLKAAKADEQNKAVISAKQAECDAIKASVAAEEALKAKIVEFEAIKAKNAEYAQAEQKRREASADDAIKAAQSRGVFPTQPAADSPEAAEIARWRSLIITDPENAKLLARMAPISALDQRITGGANKVIAIAGGADVDRAIRAYHAEKDALKRGILYASAIRGVIAKEDGFAHIVRATNTLGTAIGELIVQRALDLLKYSFPFLGRVSTDFSMDNAAWNSEVNSRLITVPTVSDYDTTNGYTDSSTTATDVPVTINAHKALQVTFNVNELASTRRMLFGEQEEAMHYAIGLALMDALTDLITTTNFTTETVAGSAIDFSRAKIIDGKIALAGRKANTGTRSALLNSTYYGQLEKDTSIVSALVNSGAGGAIATGILPPISGYLPIEADYIPTSNNLVGFMMRADALVVATRVPSDYSAAFPDVPQTALVTTITNPDTGLSVAVTKYVNHKMGTATMRVALMYGVAKGNATAGQRLVSAAN